MHHLLLSLSLLLMCAVPAADPRDPQPRADADDLHDMCRFSNARD
jgi:hypothetical protein